MSNETDLDWLARNVHVWPVKGNQPWCYVVTGIDGVRTCAGNVIVCRFPYTKIEREQWIARRAELQNKPSWEWAPEWAHWLGQDQDAVWYWHGEKPEAKGEDVNGQRYWMSRGLSDIANRGVLLGDWRDTLERRPESPEKFKPITNIEDNQEQDMTQQATTQQAEKQQDNSWFERGELPPVGEVCEIHHKHWSNEKFHKVKVLAITYEHLIVRYETFEQHYLLKDMSFRQIRTERELAIEEMMKTINVIDFVGTPHHLISEISAIMYDAGYRKDPK